MKTITHQTHAATIKKASESPTSRKARETHMYTEYNNIEYYKQCQVASVTYHSCSILIEQTP